jgi:type IV secretory pathway protease TraF
VPLLKHVAALGGQRVCRVGPAVSIDGVTVGAALGHDRRGRPLPVWQGCTVLAADQVFLFNADRPDSLDGRYFGPLSRTTMVGRAQPIWTRSGN